MSNKEIVKNENAMVMSTKELITHIHQIQDIMKSVMHEDVHYGIIPGCKQPSLYKAGAEKIAVTFKLSIKTDVENLSTDDYAKFRVTASAYSINDKFLGSATGICSSLEEKYKWRRPICVEEFDETPENRKREKWSKGWKGLSPSKNMQVRTEAADIENTVLQMADKRAYVAVVRKVTAASDVFTQDVEDIPSEIIQSDAPVNSSEPEMPKQKTSSKSKTCICSSCSDSITEKVNDYSIKKHGKALCFECQKKV